MHPNHNKLFVGKSSRLGEDVGGDDKLSDVVQETSHDEGEHIFP